MSQADLVQFGNDDARPDDEAVAVADDSRESGASVVIDEETTDPSASDTVTVAVNQVNYTLEGRGRNEEPLIHVFGRTPGGKSEHVVVRNFRPYFYALTDEVTSEDLDRDEITGSEKGYVSIRGESLTRIYARTPRDVGQIRDRFTHFEADVLFPTRFLIDKGIKSGIRVPDRRRNGRIEVDHEAVEPVDAFIDPRVHMVDIEVDDRSGFPEDGEEPIICLTSHDSERNEFVVWLYRAPDAATAAPSSLENHDLLDPDASVEIREFDDEAAMLDDYLSYFEETDPDLISGWNCLPADSEISMADGRKVAIEDVEIGDKVVGIDDKKTTVSTVTNQWESEKEILEFGLEDGSSFRSSGEHRLMAGDEDDVAWKRTQDVEPGDYLLKPSQLRVRDPSVPQLADLIPLELQRFQRNESILEFKEQLPYGAITSLADEWELKPETLHHTTRSVWNVGRCAFAAEQFDGALPDGGRIYRRNGEKLDRQITKDELYLAGLILADGSLSRTDGMRFYNVRKELHRAFDPDPHLEHDGKGCFKQNVLSYAMMYAFNGLGIPFGNKNESKVDLSRIYSMPEEFIAHFLAGVIDGDGNVNTSVSVSAQNYTIGEWYSRLFRRLGIYTDRHGRTVRVPNSERFLSIVDERIRPLMRHSKKRAAIGKLEGGKSGRSENIPPALFEAPVGSDARRIGRDKQRRGINLKRHETTIEDWDEFVFVRVDSITQAETETTYDLETTTSNFVAEDCVVHNCDDFDAPYLLDRLERLDPRTDLDLSIERFSPVDEVWRDNWRGPNIKGRVLFDLLYGYRRTQFTELDSYRLDAVGEVELGEKKEVYTGSIGDLWEQDPERLLEYNLRDVELCVEIDRKQAVIAFWNEVRTFVGCKLEDAPTPGDTVDVYVLHKVHDEFVLPSKGQVEGEDYEGGAVFDPITGVREMVSVLDLASLYPMAMTTINASPETKVEPETYDGETYLAPNGTHFRKEPNGIIREMVDELLAERDEKKWARNEHEPGTSQFARYDRQQQAVKVLMNSLYGVLGWDRFRLYDREMGAAVTATGRDVLKFTEESANNIGYQVVYGDTDSVMLEISDEQKEKEVIEQSLNIQEHINDSYDAFARETLNAENHRFEIEFEKLYRRFFQAGKKKRYAGHAIWKEGVEVDDVDIVGFEYQRSDIAPITKDVQLKVIELIVTGDELEADLAEAKTYLSDVIQDFLAGNIDLDAIGIPGGIGKRLDNYDTDTAHVRGAKYANTVLGANFKRGSKPKRYYLKGVHPGFFRRLEDEEGLDPRNGIYGEFKRDPDVICVEFAEEIPAEFEIDYEKMLDKTLQGPISRILTALDLSWEEIKSGQEQTGLGTFV